MTPEDLKAVAEAFRERYLPGRVRGLSAAGSGLELAVPGGGRRTRSILRRFCPSPSTP